MTPCCGAFLQPCMVMVPTGRVMCHGCHREVVRALEAAPMGYRDIRLPIPLTLTEKGWAASSAS